MFGVVGDRIGHRDLLAMMRATYAVLAVTLMTLVLTGTSEPALRLHHCDPDGPGPAVRPRRARRAGGDHHAARSPDRCDQRLPHHHGHRAHRRRAVRRRIVRRARHGPGLCRDRQPLYPGHAAHAVRGRGCAEEAPSGRGRRRRYPACLAPARSQGGRRLYLDHAADAGGDVDRLPRQSDRLSAVERTVALYRQRRSTAPTRPGSAISRRALRSAR